MAPLLTHMKLKDLEVQRYKLEEPTTIDIAGGEAYIHPLVGFGDVDGVQLGGRTRIFAPPGEGYYLSKFPSVRINPRGNGAFDVLVVTAPLSNAGARDVRVAPIHHTIGDGCHEREVYEILGADGPAQRIRLGETFNVKGGWSSWPPHSFDKKPELAPQFEEIFVPFLRPRDGLALLRRKGVFFDGTTIDDTLTLASGECVNVPLGEHPIVAGPGVELMYVWCYLSPVDKKYSRWADEVGGYE